MGGQSSPEEDPNSLISHAYVTLLLLIGEGPIKGYAKEKEGSVFLDNTRLRASKGVTCGLRRGLINQKIFPQIKGIGIERSVGVKLLKNQPITRTIDNPDIDAVQVRLTTPALMKYEEDGDIKGSTVDYKISVANKNGNFVTKVDRELRGKTSGEYQFDFRIKLDKGEHPWRVRVQRMSKESNSTKKQNDIYWQAYTEIVSNQFTYPGSALLGVRFDAKYYQNLPSVSVLLKGLLIQIPSNYNPGNRTYAGIWDGTFKKEYSNNPAWCLYDILTNRRYGCGRFISENRVDKWTLYSIGQYCDQPVLAPNGGTEPRFTFNAYIQNREDAYQVIAAMLSVFRGILYESNGGLLYTSLDSPSQVVRVYSESNVIQEVDDNGNITKPPFQYSGTSAKVRHNVALVTYQDKTDKYRSKVAYVQDIEGIQRYGYRETQITAFGCTSRGQANRLGKWTLLSERLETTTVTFTVGSEGMLVRPGEIIGISDPSVSGYRAGGRVKSYNSETGVITLDSAHYIQPGTYIYTLSPNGVARNTPVTNTVGTTTNLIQTNTEMDGIDYGTPYLIYFDNILEPEQFRVRSIEENEDDATYTITAIEHNPSKFDAVDFDQSVVDLPVSVIPNPFNPPPTPTNVMVQELIVQESNSTGLRVKLDITWGSSASYYPCKYVVRRKSVHTWPSPSELGGALNPLFKEIANALNSSPWVYESPTPALSLQILDAKPGYYSIEVFAVNSFDVYSNAASSYTFVYGLTRPPATPTNFRINGFGESASLVWDATPDIDVRIGGSFEIRYSRFITSSWIGSTQLATAAGTATSVNVPARPSGLFLIKAVDSSGIYSTDHALVQFTSTITNKNYVYQRVFDVTQGTTDKLFPLVADDLTTTLRLTSQAYFDSTTGNFDANPGVFDSIGLTFDYAPVVNLLDRADSAFDDISGTAVLNKQGYWYDVGYFDMGDIYPVKLTGDVDFESVTEQPDFLSYTGSFDSKPGLFDGQNLDIAYAVIQVSSSNDLTTWDEYKTISNNEFVARAFKFRISAATSQDAYNVDIKGGEVEVDLPERFESGVITTVALSTTNITFPSGFYETPEIAVTLQNGRSGDYFAITNLSRTGFTLGAYNGSYLLSNAIARTMSYVVRGIGKAVI